MRTSRLSYVGCKVNQYETEELREQLRMGGYHIVPMEEGADVVIVNSCSVTADADSSCRQLVRKVLRENPIRAWLSQGVMPSARRMSCAGHVPSCGSVRQP